MSRSLRQRLLWILLSLILFAWVSSAALTGMYASRVMRAQVDVQLEQYSDLVSYITQVFARQVEEGLPVYEPWLRDDLDGVDKEPMIIDAPVVESLSPALNVWLGDTLLAVLETSPRFERPQEEGFSSLKRHGTGKHWRLLARYDEPSGLWILVGIEVDAARRSMLGIIGRALFPLLVILPLTVALLYFGVSRGLRPLHTLAQQIRSRNPRLLDSVPAGDVPDEIQPVVAALNALLDRLGHALESEQRFTANAAHELMTPLAAIKTEVQLCQRQAEDASSRAMLGRIALRVDRASHTVEQLLTLARIDPDSPLALTEVNLSTLLVEVVAETAHLASQRGLEITLEKPDGVRVPGNEEALAIALRNLLINAFRYALEGSTVTITLTAPASTSGALLSISNACAPLPAEEFGRIKQRFYRVPGSLGQGAGLGLSIVSRIAQQHGARFETAQGEAGQRFITRLEFI